MVNIIQNDWHLLCIYEIYTLCPKNKYIYMNYREENSKKLRDSVKVTNTSWVMVYER